MGKRGGNGSARGVLYRLLLRDAWRSTFVRILRAGPAEIGLAQQGDHSRELAVVNNGVMQWITEV